MAASVRRGSVGVLGGTFDPIHIAHLAVAEEAREALGLEKILFIPAAMPPHKVDRPVSEPHHRLAMVELAIADNPAFEASRVELDRSGPSYTVDTLERLAAATVSETTRFGPPMLTTGPRSAAPSGLSAADANRIVSPVLLLHAGEIAQPL